MRRLKKTTDISSVLFAKSVFGINYIKNTILKCFGKQVPIVDKHFTKNIKVPKLIQKKRKICKKIQKYFETFWKTNTKRW